MKSKFIMFAMLVALVFSVSVEAKTVCSSEDVPACAPNQNCMLEACYDDYDGEVFSWGYKCYTVGPLGQRTFSVPSSYYSIPTGTNNNNVYYRGFNFDDPSELCYDDDFPQWFKDSVEALMGSEYITGNTSSHGSCVSQQACASFGATTCKGNGVDTDKTQAKTKCCSGVCNGGVIQWANDCVINGCPDDQTPPYAWGDDELNLPDIPMNP